MKYLTIALLLLATPALAGDWRVLPDPAWSGDASVNVEYTLRDGSATGPLIGAAQVFIGPLQTGTPRPVSGAAFDGSGKTVFLVANAARGTTKSVVVSLSQTFPLAPPLLSVP